MVIEPSKIKEIISLVNVAFPGWDGFSYPDFENEEIEYKQNAIKLAKELLNKGTLEHLVFIKGDYDEVIRRIERVGRSTNLLFLGVPRTGDLNILYQENMDKLAFCKQLFDLLYGKGDSPDRLERYIDYVKANELPNKWTFPTYLLFMCSPESEMFIKPTTVKSFLEQMDALDQWSATPTRHAYGAVLSFASELKEALNEYQPRDMVDIQSIIWIVGRLKMKLDEFSRLFQEFTQTYLISKAGQEHLAFYRKAREQARKNLEDIERAVEKGQDVTEVVLLKLLPYSNTIGNRERGAWIHIAPSITKDVKDWFQKAGWTQPEDWPKIARAILGFVQQCLADPALLSKACMDFSELPYTKGFQSGMLTPILNALHPEDYVLINNKSRVVLNYFTDTNYDQSLKYYPETNQLAQSFIGEIRDELTGQGSADVHDTDLIDMFSHWMVAVKKFFQPAIVKLASPFSIMFTNIEQAHWAFDLLKDVADRLGVTGLDDPLAAFTLRKRAGEYLLRLSYGNWLMVGFSGHDNSLKSLILQRKVGMG